MDDSVKGAIVGASVALIGLIVGKENKTSEFRQQWIDGLRNDIANFISLSINISANKSDDKDDMRAANESLARISLRLNPKEKTSQDLSNALNKLKDSAELLQFSDSLNFEVQDKARVVLGNEWRRVKRGEWRYVILLSLSVVSLAVSFIVFVFHLVKTQ